MTNHTPEPWIPKASDMPNHIYAAKRVNVVKCDGLDSWWSGHGKDEGCSIEGTPSHWFWLAYLLLGFVEEKDAPYTEDKPLPYSPKYIRSCIEACRGMADPDAEIARLRERAREQHAWEEMAEWLGLRMSPEGAKADIARLRTIEARARAAGMLTADGVLIVPGMDVYVPGQRPANDDGSGRYIIGSIDSREAIMQRDGWLLSQFREHVGEPYSTPTPESPQ